MQGVKAAQIGVNTLTATLNRTAQKAVAVHNNPHVLTALANEVLGAANTQPASTSEKEKSSEVKKKSFLEKNPNMMISRIFNKDDSSMTKDQKIGMGFLYVIGLLFIGLSFFIDLGMNRTKNQS